MKEAQPHSADRLQSRRIYLAIGLALATLVIIRFLYGIDPQGTPLQTDLKTFPLTVGGWVGEEGTMDQEIVDDVLGLEDWLHRWYRNSAGEIVHLYIGYMGPWNAAKKRQAYHSPQFCYPAGGWKIVQNEIHDLLVPGGGSVRLNKVVVQKGLRKDLLLYCYQWGDRLEPEGYVGSMMEKLDWLVRLPLMLVSNKRTDRSIIRLSSPVVGSVEETLALQVKFFQVVLPPLTKQFSLDFASR